VTRNVTISSSVKTAKDDDIVASDDDFEKSKPEQKAKSPKQIKKKSSLK
jgi:hypothetical protein